MAENPWWREHELANSIARVLEICQTTIFTSNEANSWRGEAIFTLLMINLDDILQFLSKEGRRVDFTADVVIEGREAADVTDLVNAFRNIVCHLPSERRTITRPTAVVRNTYVVVRGKFTAIQLDDWKLGCDYADDVAILCGPNRIYWLRHIVRAANAARSALRFSWE